jgi:hypothetical protein
MQGNTATIVFGTSGFAANVQFIDGTEQERPDIETSHLGTEDDMEFEPGDLKNAGEFEVEFQFKVTAATDRPPIDAAAETVTITFPNSGTTAGTLAGTAYIKKWKSGGLRNNELSVGTATVKWDGKTGPAWTNQV